MRSTSIEKAQIIVGKVVFKVQRFDSQVNYKKVIEIK
jgi:hypothetical protein